VNINFRTDRKGMKHLICLCSDFRLDRITQFITEQEKIDSIFFFFFHAVDPL